MPTQLNYCRGSFVVRDMARANCALVGLSGDKLEEAARQKTAIPHDIRLLGLLRELLDAKVTVAPDGAVTFDSGAESWSETYDLAIEAIAPYVEAGGYVEGSTEAYGNEWRLVFDGKDGYWEEIGRTVFGDEDRVVIREMADALRDLMRRAQDAGLGIHNQGALALESARKYLGGN